MIEKRELKARNRRRNTFRPDRGGENRETLAYAEKDQNDDIRAKVRGKERKGETERANERELSGGIQG